MIATLIFDDGLGRLAPLNDLRPVWAIKTGAINMIDRLLGVFDLELKSVHVRPEHEALAREQFPDLPISVALPADEPVLCVNGRCVLPDDEFLKLEPGQSIVEEGTGHLVAAMTRGGRWADAGAFKPRLTLPTGTLIARPWHFRGVRDACLELDLAILHNNAQNVFPTDMSFSFGRYPLTIHPKAKIYPGVVLDREAGPIVIAEHATLRAGCTVIGPAYVGPHSTVLDRAIIKGNTSIGPWCKVAGEVGGTIFQGFANKSHDGHLGDSWVGEWANLGAGTTNSNLLNTYAEVTMRAAPDAPLERTGHQFMGAIIGDHVKTAICTRIMTGTVLHTGAMIATSAAAAGTVAPFSWCTDAGTKRFRHDKFVEIARTVMGRRNLVPGAAYVRRLAELHQRAGT